MTFFEWFYKVVIIESVCVLLVISSVFIIKYFFKSEYPVIQEFYKIEIMSDTDVLEVLSGEI